MDKTSQRTIDAGRSDCHSQSRTVSFSLFLSLLSTFFLAGPLGWNGVAGEPKARTKYSFSIPPRLILEGLHEIELGSPPTITAEEWKVLDAAWALQDASDEMKRGPDYDRLVIRGLLTASGVQTETEIAEYSQKLERVIEGAREAVKQGNGTHHAGETLMRFLHSGLMNGGYDAEQSSFSGVFDTHKYNCVSSTAVYYIVGNALGLKMRLISIPGGFIFSGHVCVDVLDGEMIFEVEPTNSDGFDWGRKSNEPGVFTLGYQPDRKDGQTIEPMGLASLIYSNRGVQAAKAEQPEPLAGLSLGLRGVMINPCCDSVIENVVAVFTNWGQKLAKDGRYEDALRVLEYGHRTTGASSVRENLTSVWSDTIQSLMIDHKDLEAQAAIERAVIDLPHESDFDKGRCWERYMESLFLDSASGPRALDAANRALAVIPESQRANVLAMRTALIRRLSQYFLDEQNIDGALKVLATGYELDPNDREMHQGIAYFVQESLNIVDSNGSNPQAAVSQHIAVRTVFPQTEFVAERAEAHVRRALDALASERKFDAAFTAARTYAPLARSVKEESGFLEQVWELWGESFVETNDWERGIEILVKGLREIPESNRLKNSIEVAVDRWADAKMETGEWDAAIRIYDRGLEILPQCINLKLNRELCVEKKTEAAGK